MGKKAAQEKTNGYNNAKQAAAPKANGKKGAAAAAAASPAFRLPEPDRVFNVSCPAVLPPVPVDANEEAEEDCEQEYEEGSLQAAYAEVMPRKLQLGHLPLLMHPVYIGAIDNMLMEDECRHWIDWGEKLGFEEAKQRQTSEMAFRDNGRIEIDSDEVAQLLWLRIRPFVPDELPPPPGAAKGVVGRRALGCSPRIRLYRYSRGQRFGQHVDGSRDEPSLGGRTHFTVLVYLNGGDRDAPNRRIRGGETVFWKDRGGNPTTVALSFPPTRGICLFHGHGDECMIHEGAPVEDGNKYVLRTDVVYELDK